MIYFISDTHFGHRNILKYEKEARPFETIEEMNEVLIKNWNDTVKEEDTVYMLGDMFMGSSNLVDEIMGRLKGKKILIRGNHDTNTKVEIMKPYLEGVYDIYNLKYNRTMLILCHYPIREWAHKENGSLHLYGHVHSSEHRNGTLLEKNSYHVGVDTNDLKPVPITKFFPCYHENISSEVSKITGEFNYHICTDCGEFVNKYIINNKEVWL